MGDLSRRRVTACPPTSAAKRAHLSNGQARPRRRRRGRYVVAFEDGDSPALMAGHEADLREALEAAGVKFDGDDVTLASRGRGG